MKRWALWVSGLAIFAAALWTGWSFRAENSSAIELDLIWIQLPNVELWRAILIAVALGAVGASVLVGFAWLRSRLLNRRYRSVIRRLESELHQMRSLPLSGSEGVEAPFPVSSAVSSPASSPASERS
jgi:uncharacterized membrane protein YciS (DUF1049 family)